MSNFVSSSTFYVFGNENLFKMWNVIPIGICVLPSISLSHGFFSIIFFSFLLVFEHGPFMRINEIHDEKKKNLFILEIFDYLIVFNLISLSLST